MGGFFSQLPCKCHLAEVASTGDSLKICPQLDSRPVFGTVATSATASPRTLSSASTPPAIVFLISEVPLFLVGEVSLFLMSEALQRQRPSCHQ